tara:strand:+ start:9896 stop:10981 length:1086 start_codon:yes stop_codon:yes gene_type:complete
MKVSVYLADQNPQRDRSVGISKMTDCLLHGLSQHSAIELNALVSKSSVRAPEGIPERTLPWRTDQALARLITDHFHALSNEDADIFYYPKGFVGLVAPPFGKTVVTIHDTIIQHYSDHYPDSRSSLDFQYWIGLMKHTLRVADLVLTVSQNSKLQILKFCSRHHISPPQINVTYEASSYENWKPDHLKAKSDYVVLLASKEPHKRTIETIQFWKRYDQRLPELRIIGSLSEEAEQLLESANHITQHPFLPEALFVEQISNAGALFFPSEIEGFGLPAIESYFLGTPCCVGTETAMDEVLKVATSKGRFDLNDDASALHALEETLSMSPQEVEEIGDNLKETYSAENFAKSVASAFECALAN